MELFTLPPDFISKMQRLIPAEWEKFEKCYRNNKYQGLRFNPLKKGLCKQDYSRILSDLAIWETQPVLWAEHAYYYDEEARPGKHPYHEAGLYYIQEPSAMCAAALLAPSPGERVLDLCAAPGGKATQLAGFLKQEGLLVCNEIHQTRCKILSQNIERMGIANAIVTNENSETLAKHFPEYFHKILVDAPCSGEGMFRKNPEAALEWSKEQVEICAKRQSEILENAAKMLMPEGIMLYSTCTFSPEENECVIGDFLEAHPEFSIVRNEAPYFSSGCPAWGNGMEELADTYRLWPHRLQGEGHFAALLRKEAKDKKDETSGKNRKERKDKKGGQDKILRDKKLLEEIKKFTSQMLTKQMEDYILSGDFVLFGEQLYRLPQGAPDLSGLRVLRPGLHIGSFGKNSFKPAHALALFLGQEDVNNKVIFSLADERAKMYYNGEAIDIENFQISESCKAANEEALQINRCGEAVKEEVLQINRTVEKGWCLVCINGYSVGWGKIAGGMMKNHYPKGLRKEVIYR